MDNNGEDDKPGRNIDCESGFNLVDSQDLNKTEMDAMRGDIIGDTVYSGKWIIKTLISLSKVSQDGWTESLESDLCLLWDMTAEKDVVHFLRDNDFFQIAEFILKISEEPRLTEIIIGIIGNMCCQPTILEDLGNAENLITIIFGLLRNDDTKTLVQILRILQSCVWDVHKNSETKWLRVLKDCEFLGDGLSFILQSSTNEDLLTATVELLQSIATVEMPDESSLLAEIVRVDQLVPALVESFGQLMPRGDFYNFRSGLKFIENWLTIFSHVMQSKPEVFRSESSEEIIPKIVQALFKILQPYEHSENLFSLKKKIALCIRDCVEIISWFERCRKLRFAKIVRLIVTIMHELREAIKKDTEMDGIMNLNGAKELANYLENYWIETLRAYEEIELLEIFQLCDKEVIESLMDVAKEYSAKSADAVAKLLRVESLSLDE